jgi:hypothetical protein
VIQSCVAAKCHADSLSLEVEGLGPVNFPVTPAKGPQACRPRSAGLTADLPSFPAVQQRVSAIESGSVAELATLADYIRALGGELKVIADFGDSWRRVA